jgi:hypothetical protein
MRKMNTTTCQKKHDQLADEYQPVTEAIETTADYVASALGIVADELEFGFSACASGHQ